MSKLLVDEISDADNTGPVTVTDGAVVNRTGDGTIIDLQYGGTTVWSIGAANGNLYLGQGDTTIMFSASADAVLPKGTDGADRDGFINLGQNINRFKDLYLSGGVYLGGTGSANYLSDYEEGTWTPSVGGSAGYNSQVGKYTKVGNMVTVWFNQYLAAIGTGSTTTISGLPFAVSNIAEFNVNGNQLSYFTGLNGTYTFVAAYVVRNATTISFVTVGGSGASSSSADTAVLQSNCDIYGNITYRTG